MKRSSIGVMLVAALALTGCATQEGAADDAFASASGLTGTALESGQQVAKDICANLSTGAATGKFINTTLSDLASKYDVNWYALGSGEAPEFENLLKAATTAYCPDMSAAVNAFFE